MAKSKAPILPDVEYTVIRDEPAMDVLTEEIISEPIPSELEVFVHALRLLADQSPLKSKINRLIDEIEAAFRF